MKRRPLDQSGFVPLLITVMLVVIVVIYLVYSRVLQAKH